ncbi:diacylglycerol kinase family lipid kinase [Sphingosinicellaceae bacterium A1X5R2]|nr:diacylglycerol kinase family lipid kinase [Pedomonas mirosovicensis]
MASILTRHGAQVELAPTEGPGHATVLARQAAASGAIDTVVASGGDGTCGEVMAGLIGSPVPMAILPAGTANVAALSLGLPRDADALARTLLSGPAISFRPALANGQPFLCVASVGVDAEAVRRVSLTLKQRAGKLAYAMAGISALTEPPPRLEVHAGGQHFEAAQVILSRVPYYAGRFRLFPDALPFDNRLNVLVVRAGSRLEVTRFALAAALGRQGALRGVHRFAADQAQVRASGPVPAQVDGDFLGMTPVTFSLAPEQVRLRRPAGF